MLWTLGKSFRFLNGWTHTYFCPSNSASRYLPTRNQNVYSAKWSWTNCDSELCLSLDSLGVSVGSVILLSATFLILQGLVRLGGFSVSLKALLIRVYEILPCDMVLTFRAVKASATLVPACVWAQMASSPKGLIALQELSPFQSKTLPHLLPIRAQREQRQRCVGIF